jgi:uncharacterized delta-60 repeat protein
MVAPQVKVAGSWIIPKSAWTKINGQWRSWFLQGGILDTSFATNTGTGANNNVQGVAVQQDGKIIIVGGFSTFNGTTVNKIARLNPDGTLDTAFTSNIGSGFTGGYASPLKVAIQQDGKIIVVGSFTSFNETVVNSIARLNSNGTLDTSFKDNTGTGIPFFYFINSLSIQSDGKIVIVGDFPTFNGTASKNIARLNSDGTLDTAFSANIATGPDSSIQVVKAQSDGKIIFVGGFVMYNGYTLGAIARLNSNGTLDTAFAANTGVGTGDGGAISTLDIQSDGKIIISGGFSSFNGASGGKRIVRLNPNGTLDTAFDTAIGSGVDQPQGVGLDEEERIIIAKANTPRLIRLNQDGTTNSVFQTNTGTGLNSTVFGIKFANQIDKKVVIAGNFTSFNGVSVSRVARIGGDAAS